MQIIWARVIFLINAITEPFTPFSDRKQTSFQVKQKKKSRKHVRGRLDASSMGKSFRAVCYKLIEQISRVKDVKEEIGDFVLFYSLQNEGITFSDSSKSLDRYIPYKIYSLFQIYQIYIFLINLYRHIFLIKIYISKNNVSMFHMHKNY